MSKPIRHTSHRAHVRNGLAVVLATALTITGLTSASGEPASAAVSSADSAVSSSASQVSTIPLPPAPYSRSLSASFPSTGHPQLSIATRRITVELPAEVSDFSPSSVSITFRGDGAGFTSSVPVDPSTRRIEVEIPEGFYASAEGTPRVAKGVPKMDLIISSSSPAPAVATPSAPYPNSNGGFGFSMLTVFVLADLPGTTAPDASVVPADSAYFRDLDDAAFSSFVYRSDYWSAPADELRAASGDRVVVTGTPAWTGPVTATILSPADSTARATVAIDVPPSDSETALTIPDDVALIPILAGNGRAFLRLEGSSGRNTVTLDLPLSIIHAPTFGPGVTTRISGANRYSGAVAYSQASWPTPVRDGKGISNLFLASGEVFPDALSAAAIAAPTDGELLLLPRDYPVEGGALTELDRLLPQGGWVVGGQNVVSENLRVSIGGDENLYLSRIAGADRYETSRQLVGFAFGGGTKTVFLATGETFPDALSAVSAATSQHAPVLLVRGSQPTLDAATLATLTNIGASSFVLVGGNLSISTGIEQQLNAQHPGSVTRIGGVDRYAVSAAINQRYFPTATQAFLATGASYPDALSGGVLAARAGAPLLLVQPNCVPAPAGAALSSWNVATTTLLGGPASLSRDVLDLTPCP